MITSVQRSLAVRERVDPQKLDISPFNTIYTQGDISFERNAAKLRAKKTFSIS